MVGSGYRVALERGYLVKAESYYLVNDAVRNNAIMQIKSLPVDGKIKLVISNAGTKSTKQRGLQWKWYTETAEAGIGGKHEDTKEGVALITKWRWVIPILLRDDEMFSDLFSIWKQLYGDDEERMLWLTSSMVHTESLSTSQMAEVLTDFQRYYGQKVNLTDPKDYGLSISG